MTAGIGRIVVGVGHGRSSLAALRWALRRAISTGARLQVVTAVGAPVLMTSPVAGVVPLSDPRRTERITREWQQAIIDESTRDVLTVPIVEAVVVMGSPVGALRRASEDADLVVVGSAGRWRLRPIAARCRRVIACPVVTIIGDRPK